VTGRNLELRIGLGYRIHVAHDRLSIRVVVIVLGDLGRSPRMLSHARALAKRGAQVDLVGYLESGIGADLARSPQIQLHPLRAPVSGATGVRAVAYAAMRMLREGFALLRLLLTRLPRPEAILLQNPPAIPALLPALLAARLRGARLILDWHNFGSAMLGLGMGRNHPATRLLADLERRLGARADAHVCVSAAMQAALEREKGVLGAVVLHDHPDERFARTPEEQRRALLARLAPELAPPDRERAPALVVSPTSWSRDEDFGVLLEAARDCDARWRHGDSTHPDLLIAVTGRGPLREHYLREMHALELERIHLRSLWLEPEDYPAFIGSADLGLCLHRSASGVDLPMKLADFRGAGVPVCTLDYGPCLAERFLPERDGLLFRDAADLAGQLDALFRGYPGEESRLARLRRRAAEARGESWDDAWEREALPLFLNYQNTT
jgi:beta-1,4-mannosyltransferase